MIHNSNYLQEFKNQDLLILNQQLGTEEDHHYLTTVDIKIIYLEIHLNKKWKTHITIKIKILSINQWNLNQEVGLTDHKQILKRNN